MMNRVTMENLHGLCGTLNRLTDSPKDPYTTTLDENGKQTGFTHNPGCFYISAQNGMVILARMGSGGGEERPLGNTWRTKRELFDLMHAYLDGYWALHTAQQDMSTKLTKVLESLLDLREVDVIRNMIMGNASVSDTLTKLSKIRKEN